MQSETVELSAIDNYAEEINRLHGDFESIGRQNTEGLIRQINLAREVGIKLMAAKALPESRGRFKQMFSESATRGTFGFSYRTAARYMRVAKMLPEAITSLPEGAGPLRDMFRMSDALPEPNSEGRSPKGSRSPYELYAPKIVDVASVVAKWRQVEPPTQWPEDHKESVRDQLEPLVELYRELGGEV